MDTIIYDILRRCRRIAVVGLSPKENRPSNQVARYLLDAGYEVIPVNPGQQEILGRPCYPNLQEIPGRIDIVDIFRRSEEVLPIVKTAVELGVAAVWLQQGIVNDEAARLARQAGIKIFMDRCLKIDHSSSAICY